MAPFVKAEEETAPSRGRTPIHFSLWRSLEPKRERIRAAKHWPGSNLTLDFGCLPLP